MVGHHAPGEEPIALRIEVMQCMNDFLSDGRNLQVASSRAAVQKTLDHGSRQTLDFAPFVRAEVTVKLVCGFDDRLPLGFDLIEDGFGQGIG